MRPLQAFLLLPALLLAGFLFGQKTQPGLITEHGFRFVNHTEKPGPKVQPGDIMLVQTYTWIGDSLMASTIRMGGPREYTLFKPDQLPARVPALYDAALRMAVGDSISVFEKIDSFLQKFIPPSLKSATEVRYDVVLLKITSAEEMAKAADDLQKRFDAIAAEATQTIKDYQEGKFGTRLLVTQTGLKVLMLDPGKGAPVRKGESVKTHYYGAFLDGEMFDNSFQRGEPIAFTVGIQQMIAGFDEGTMLLHHGGRAYFFLPYQLAYGEEGSSGIPPKTDLVFYVELL